MSLFNDLLDSPKKFNTLNIKSGVTVMKPAFTKYQLADQMRNYMHVDDKFLGGLSRYHMIHDSGAGFKSLLAEGTLTYHDHITKVSELHNVIYHNCTPFNAKRAVEVRLSFRAALPEYNLEPIVLVEIVIPFTGEK